MRLKIDWPNVLVKAAFSIGGIISVTILSLAWSTYLDVQLILRMEAARHEREINQEDFNKSIQSAVNHNAGITQINVGEIIRIKAKLRIE